MTTKQKLILFLISCDPGVKDTYSFIKFFDMVAFPAKIDDKLRPLLDDQLIVATKWYDGRPSRPLAYSITPKGQIFLDENFNDKETIDYLTEMPLPNTLLEITKIYIDKKITLHQNEPNKKIILFCVTIVMILLGFFVYKIKQFGDTLSEMGPCGLNIGPCNGRKISLNPDTISVDTYFDIPNGRLSFTRSADTLPPILIKTDKSNKLVWAIELKTSTKECNIPFCKMSFIKLTTNKSENKITFNNGCFGEPGTIYLTKDFDFDHMCLCSM